MKGNLIFFVSDQQTIRHNYQLLHAVAIGLSTDRVGILADKLMFLFNQGNFVGCKSFVVELHSCEIMQFAPAQKI